MCYSGLPFGMNLCGAVQDTASGSSQIANSPEIGSNIEERAAVWNDAPGGVSLRQRKHRHHSHHNRKPVKMEKVGFPVVVAVVPYQLLLE